MAGIGLKANISHANCFVSFQIGQLLAENEKLQARVKELESALAAREVATPTGVEGALEKLSEVVIQVLCFTLLNIVEAEWKVMGAGIPVNWCKERRLT